MPNQSGFDIHKKIKKEFPSVKVLVASVFNQSYQKLMLPDADEYYDKSEDAGDLVKKIEKLLYAESRA